MFINFSSNIACSPGKNECQLSLKHLQGLSVSRFPARREDTGPALLSVCCFSEARCFQRLSLTKAGDTWEAYRCVVIGDKLGHIGQRRVKLLNGRFIFSRILTNLELLSNVIQWSTIPHHLNLQYFEYLGNVS